ncbi:MAG: hypothetical protein K5829_02530 [Treponema sp.]|nr:hypothetical protein [Treponema sp.]
MKKQNALSFYELVTFVTNNSSNFSEMQDLINTCRNIHTLSFDYNTAKAFNTKSKEELEKMEVEIDLQIEKVIEKINASFDFNSDNLKLTKESVFNDIIMPLSKVEDK